VYAVKREMTGELRVCDMQFSLKAVVDCEFIKEYIVCKNGFLDRFSTKCSYEILAFT